MPRRGVAAIALLTACAAHSAPPAAWSDAEYAAAVARIQSCAGDATLGPALLLPAASRFTSATHNAAACLASHSGCDAVSACLGIVVTQDPACVPACEGDNAITCRTNFRTTTHCGLFGSTCASGAGGPMCADSPAVSAPCTATPTCEDSDILRDCDTRASCAASLTGSTCVAGQCLLDATCTPGKILDGLACSGKSLRVCVAGRVETVDCLALGFTGCDPFTRGCSPNPLLAP